MTRRWLSPPRTRRSAWLALVAAAVVAACTSAALRLPEQLRALPDPVETRAAILDGMQSRRWSMMDERPQAILAGIEVRGHVAKMWVEYDAEFVRFRYGGSTALDCRPSPDGCSSIRGKYMQWTRNLAAAIADEIATRRKAAGGATQEAPPPRR